MDSISPASDSVDQLQIATLDTSILQTFADATSPRSSVHWRNASQHKNTPSGIMPTQHPCEGCENGQPSLAAEMEQRLLHVQSELELLREGKKIEVGRFSKMVKAELKHIRKNFDPSCAAKLATSNIGHLECIWANVKRCGGVIAIEKEFSFRPLVPKGTVGRSSRGRGPKQRLALIDIVAEDGLEWIKIDQKTENKMLHDLAKAGIGSWDESGGSDEEIDTRSEDEDDDDQGTTLKQAQHLLKAAAEQLVHYQHPKIRYVFPRLRRGGVKEVERVLEQLTSYGITVETAEDIPPDVSLPSVYSRVAGEQFSISAEVLNLDVNLLIGAASDLSHRAITFKDVYTSQIQASIRHEESQPFMNTYMWPIFGNKRLVCTQIAADKVAELVEEIGTKEEVARHRLLFGDKTEMSHEQRLKAFQELTDHKVPPGWQLPIEIVDQDIQAQMASLPAVVDVICKNALADTLHQSVFLSGWAEQRLTVTCNSEVTKDLRRFFYQHWRHTGERVVGPDIHAISTCRALFGKDPERRKKFWARNGGDEIPSTDSQPPAESLIEH
ncbi:hypothetical protein BP6252_00770 [Coleophoma cylindrospora]|uniref:DUF1308 domain-containing protein n=1 Tax=Coleophoma cylindrospora TaxID=1849047 RepID=A0A3D8SSJ3_9HELO|nr:hypothetical protein BP6252_00770 [Coleophoma cylindrospora]